MSARMRMLVRAARFAARSGRVDAAALSFAIAIDPSLTEDERRAELAAARAWLSGNA